jgi:Ca-activated chloride channel family protein
MASDGKLEKAKEAALMALDRLQPDDIVSVITFDSTVDVVVPATKAADRAGIRERISALTPRGETALFAGVSFGLQEVGKFTDQKRVNRIILLSDGQANVGPRSPNELGMLGESAARQGISITTIGLGLGYNEDLMTQLAMRSDGNHAFAENASDIAKIFGFELGDILSVVAQDVQVDVDFGEGIVPVRALGREAAITGHKAKVSLAQLYAKQQKYVLFEVKVPPGRAGNKRALADVAVSYANMISKKRATKKAGAAVEFSMAKDLVASRQNKKVMADAVEAIGIDNNRKAVALRDQGKVDEASQELERNAVYLKQQSAKLKSKKLDDYGEENELDSKNVKQDWGKARKTMRESQTKKAKQQSW